MASRINIDDHSRLSAAVLHTCIYTAFKDSLKVISDPEIGSLDQYEAIWKPVHEMDIAEDPNVNFAWFSIILARPKVLNLLTSIFCAHQDK